MQIQLGNMIANNFYVGLMP